MRDAPHAERRWSELPQAHRLQSLASLAEADRLLDGLERSYHLPEGHSMRIDYETYRQLLEPLRAAAENLPAVTPSPRSAQLAAFAEQIHLLGHDDHVGAFATVLVSVGRELPAEQQVVPLIALIKETGQLAQSHQQLLRDGLFHYIGQLPARHQDEPLRALANRLGDSALQIVLPEDADNFEPFRNVLNDVVEKLPAQRQREPLKKLVEAIGHQPAQHRDVLIDMTVVAIRPLPRRHRHEIYRAIVDLVD